MKIYNFGSLNLDYVYTVNHAVLPGETLASSKRELFLGGKGLNQSLALARAGAEVVHIGCVGNDGEAIRQSLAKEGIDTRWLETRECPNGHAIIQLDNKGQNSILLFKGANNLLTAKQIDNSISEMSSDDVIVLQNETNHLQYILNQAHTRRLKVIWNPSPFPDDLTDIPLEAVTCFAINEIEGAALSGKKEPESILDELLRRYPRSQVLLTLGSNGSCFADGEKRFFSPCVPVNAVDTTAAGDTFLGYFVSHLINRGPQKALRIASAAAALAVSVKGAANSIPSLEQTLDFCKKQSLDV